MGSEILGSFGALIVIFLGLTFSIFAVAPATWSYMEARLDRNVFDKDPEELQITAVLRARNTGAILVSTLVFAVSGMIVIALVLPAFTIPVDVVPWKRVLTLVLIVTSLRSMIVQGIFLWLARSNKHLRLRILRLRDIRELRMSRKTDTVVLIVEDDSILRKMFKVLLASEGYQIEVAETGQEGLEKAAQIRPHVILWDIGLPDGTDATWMVSKLPPTQLIYLTGRSDVKDLPLGSALLTKPVARDLLVSTIEAVLGRGK